MEIALKCHLPLVRSNAAPSSNCYIEARSADQVLCRESNVLRLIQILSPDGVPGREILRFLVAPLWHGLGATR